MDPLQTEKVAYYTELGIKVNNLRISVRFPKWKHRPAEDEKLQRNNSLAKTVQSKQKSKEETSEDSNILLDHYWVFSGSSSSSSRLPLPPPPVPPKGSTSPRAPDCARPPYPSSTVQRMEKLRRRKMEQMKISTFL